MIPVPIAPRTSATSASDSSSRAARSDFTDRDDSDFASTLAAAVAGIGQSPATEIRGQGRFQETTREGVRFTRRPPAEGNPAPNAPPRGEPGAPVDPQGPAVRGDGPGFGRPGDVGGPGAPPALPGFPGGPAGPFADLRIGDINALNQAVAGFLNASGLTGADGNSTLLLPSIGEVPTSPFGSVTNNATATSAVPTDSALTIAIPINPTTIGATPGLATSGIDGTAVSSTDGLGVRTLPTNQAGSPGFPTVPNPGQVVNTATVPTPVESTAAGRSPALPHPVPGPAVPTQANPDPDVRPFYQPTGLDRPTEQVISTASYASIEDSPTPFREQPRELIDRRELADAVRGEALGGFTGTTNGTTVGNFMEVQRQIGTDASASPLSEAGARMADGIITRAEIVRRDGVTEFQMRLDPPQLGTIEVRVRMTPEGIRAELTVQDEGVRRTIELQIPELKQRLESAGMDCRHCHVSTGDRRERGEDGRRRAFDELIEQTAPKRRGGRKPRAVGNQPPPPPPRGRLDVTA